MNSVLRFKLSSMMFLQYFVWGAWFVTLGAYMVKLGFTDIIGRTYATQGVAAILAPLFVGMIADRYFCAQKVLAVLQLCGACLMFWLSSITEDKTLFYWATLLYMATFMPTIALSNTIAFASLTDTKTQFPGIRVFGTLGWIVAGVTLSFVLAPLIATQDNFTIEQTAWPMRMAASAALLLGIGAWFLPNTPPQAKQDEQLSIQSILGLDIFKLVNGKAFWVFIIASLCICIPLTFYYSYTNAFLVEKRAPNAVALQSLGQVSEVVFMLLLPWFLVRFGFKTALIIGMGCWVLRYLMFAFGYADNNIILGMALGGILLHGLCYDLFFVTGQIYVDQRLPEYTRARAQSFLTLITLGIGTLLGGELANAIVNANQTNGGIDWFSVWLAPAGMALLVALVFALMFNDRQESTR